MLTNEKQKEFLFKRLPFPPLGVQWTMPDLGWGYSMPTLDWLNRAEALTLSGKAPYRVLDPVSAHGDGNAENQLIQSDNFDALEALGVSRQGAMDLLRPLLDAGVVEKVGGNKTGRMF
jgi:hypothetical protein